jgi:hypothetical protein
MLKGNKSRFDGKLKLQPYFSMRRKLKIQIENITDFELATDISG